MKKLIQLTRGLLGRAALFAMVASVPAMAAGKGLVLDGSTTVGPIAKALAAYFKKKNDCEVTVSESGSGNGAKSLLNGTCDIADMSRPMKDKEFSAAAAKGIQPVAHVVAYDGIAIAVNESNPVKKISMEQLQKVYLGEISNWKQLGGKDAEIVVVSRDTSSGTFETFEGLVMHKKPVKGSAEIVGSNQAVANRVKTTPNAIGYVGIGFLTGLKALPVNGVLPTVTTVQSGTYPIARPLFMYTNGYPKMGSLIFQFVTLHLTEDGQQMVEEIGFVPVTQY
jgi:phosphate transport system substrate-binding protein